MLAHMCVYAYYECMHVCVYMHVCVCVCKSMHVHVLSCVQKNSIAQACFPHAHTTGSTPPSANTGVIVAVTVVNITILLLTVGMLVINITLIIKRRRQPSTVTGKSEKESKGTIQIYDEVDDSITLKKPSADAKVYQDINVSRMDHSNQYASMK